jgi:hypothetical protein
MVLTIDRFEENYAVVETESKMMYNVPGALFPGAKEGDMYNLSPCENFRKEKIKQLMEDVWEVES